jgi:hypothetical protein
VGVRYAELPGDPAAGGRKRAESKPKVESPVKGERSVASREACRVVGGQPSGGDRESRAADKDLVHAIRAVAAGFALVDLAVTRREDPQGEARGLIRAS